MSSEHADRSRVARVRHRLEAAMARTFARVPAPVVERLLSRRAITAGEHRLDPQVQWADLLRQLARRPPIENGTVAHARREYRRMVLLERPAPRLPAIDDHRIPTSAGTIAARMYRPHTGGPLPLLVFLHGGGGIIGDLETHDVVCRSFARRSGVAVLAVDYRLAPEHTYASAADDALAAFRWAHAHTRMLGVRSDRIAVGGDSLGAKLATVVCQLAQLEGAPQPCFQLLVYPSTDVAADYPSRSRFADAPWLGSALISWFERHGRPDTLPLDDHRLSPLRAERLTGLAPALVVVAGFDPLRDEGIAYAGRLREAGVDVILRDEPTLPHGFLQMTGVSRAAARATDAIADHLRRVLA